MSDFQRFRNAVYFWSEHLGLLDWEIHVEEAVLKKAHADNIALVHPNWQQHLALVLWNKRNKNIIGTPEEIALHEVLHILLAAHAGLAAAAGTTEHVAVDAEEHAIIKRLMHVLQHYKESRYGS